MAVARIKSCFLFQEASEHIWYGLADRHDYSVGIDERGITDTLVYWLIKYHTSHIGSQMIVRKAKNEPTEGNDLDLYIRNGSGGFNRFALQAKVLSPIKAKSSVKKGVRSVTYPPKVYDGIQNRRGARGYQWNMLNKGEKAGLFKGYYLLYNGYSNSQLSICGLAGKASTNPYLGCSLVKPMDVEQATRSTARVRKGRRIPRTAPGYEAFHDLAAPLARPWHDLVCSTELSSGYDGKSYELAEILNNPRFFTLQPIASQVDQPGASDDTGTQSSNRVLPDLIRSDFGPRYQVILDLE